MVPKGRRRGRPGRARRLRPGHAGAGCAAPRPLPPIGIQPSATATAAKHGVAGAAADQGAHAGLLYGLGPGPGGAEVDELAVVLGLVGGPEGLHGRRGARATTACRRAKSTPWSSASARFQPKPTPRVTRPPQRWSRVATCLARRIGSCCAASRMPVPSPMPRRHGGGRGQRDQRVEAALVVVEADALDQRRGVSSRDGKMGVLGEVERVEAELLGGGGECGRRQVAVGEGGGDAQAHGQDPAGGLGGELGQRAARRPRRRAGVAKAACSRRLASTHGVVPGRPHERGDGPGGGAGMGGDARRQRHRLVEDGARRRTPAGPGRARPARRRRPSPR